MAMYRYIALMWGRKDCEAAQVAKALAARLPDVSPHAWKQAWDGAGLAIYTSGEHKGRMQTYRLQGERGAVLGRLFTCDFTSVVDDLGDLDSRKCLETKGQYLIDNYWGRYVAFLYDPESGVRYVMREPSGAFPCFHTAFKGVTIYFSDMQDAANFEFLTFTVNWEFLQAELMLPMFQKTITGLNEVSEVLPAQCVEITALEKKSRFVWNPTAVSQTEVIENPEEAAELLRETVKSTIGAVASCYDRIVHNLGGLDSSIALACMVQAPNRPEITCINFYTESAQGDERRYCRQTTEKYGVELEERELDYRKADLSKFFGSNLLANPLGVFDCIGLTGDVLSLAREIGAQALTYGVGGDQVYFQAPRNLGALDYVSKYGFFGRHTLRVAAEASRYGRKSMFATFGDMVCERMSPAPCFSYVRGLTLRDLKKPLVNTNLISKLGHERFLHPLLIPGDRDLKGKYKHILDSALFSVDYYDHWDTEYRAERLFIYFTQPIIEACLRIPSWVMTYGGIDRGLARKAFRNDLPPVVVRRLSKSTPQAYYDGLFTHNKSFLREYLLDGVLVDKGLLLRDKLEHAFTGQDIFLQITPHRLLGYWAMEVWARRWIERPMQQMGSMEVSI